jgi:stage II sporulation protein GA (sporulation sigma-E factor processing peptidase)
VYLEVYIDVIFIINFIMDLIILIIVKNIIKCPTSTLRLCLGAAVGALSACILSLLQNINVLIQFLIVYIIISYFMIVISFKKQKMRARIKGVILLYITTFFLGGVLNSLYYYTKLGYYFTEILNGRFNNISLFHNRKLPFIILAVIFTLLSVFTFVIVLKKLGRSDLGLYEIELVYRGKTNKIVGFLDTGNLLYDPIFRKPVMITDFLAIAPLLSNNQIKQVRAVLDSFDEYNEISAAVNEDLQDSIEDVEPVNIMMIPYRSVGKNNGLIPALILDELNIWNGDELTNRKRVYTAISGNILNGQREYQAILHKGIM